MLTNEKLEKLRKQVHEEFSRDTYNKSSLLKVETNCYAYAFGMMVPDIEIYRIGNFCGKKPIGEKFKSEKEILQLFLEDLKVLGIKYENLSSNKDYSKIQMSDNQYMVKLYAKIYPNGELADYHFVRCDSGIWSEKYRYSYASEMYRSDNYDTSIFHRNLVTLLITR